MGLGELGRLGQLPGRLKSPGRQRLCPPRARRRNFAPGQQQLCIRGQVRNSSPAFSKAFAAAAFASGK